MKMHSLMLGILVACGVAASAHAGTGDEDKWSLEVNSAAFSPDGKRVLLVYRDGGVGAYVTLWDVGFRERLACLAHKKSQVQFAGFLPDSEHIVVASVDGTIVLQQVKGGFREGAKMRTVRVVRAHKHLWNAALSGNGKYLVSVGFDGNEEDLWAGPDRKPSISIKLWDVEKGILIKHLEDATFGGANLALSFDGKLALTGGVDFLSGKDKGQFKLWQLETGKVLKTFDAAENWCPPVGFSADGKGLVVGRMTKRAELPWEHELAYWDIEAGKETKRTQKALVDGGFARVEPLPGNRWGAIITGRAATWARVWTWDTDKAPKDTFLASGRMDRSGPRPFALDVTGRCFSPDGKYVLATSGYNRGNGPVGPGANLINVHIWDLTTGKPHVDWEDGTRRGDFRIPDTDDVDVIVPAEVKKPGPKEARLDFFGDPLPERAVARLGSQRFRVAGEVTALAYSRDGKLLASASNSADGRSHEVILWEMPAGRRLHVFRFPGAGACFLIFSADGGRLGFLGGRSAEPVLKIWDAKSGKELLRVADARLSLARHALSFSADGKKVAGVIGNAVRVWDVDKVKQVGLLEKKDVAALCFGPGEVIHALTPEPGLGYALWDLHAGEKLGSFRAGGKKKDSPVAISADGKLIALEAGAGIVSVYEAATGREKHRLSFAPVEHWQEVAGLAFSVDAKELVATITGGLEGHLRLWDLESGKLRLSLTDRSMGALAEISPDGKTLTCAEPRTHAILLWDAKTGKRREVAGLGPAGTDGEPNPIVTSVDGRITAAGGKATIALWETATGRPLQTFAGHSEGTAALAVSPDGATLASAGWRDDTGVTLWNVKMGAPFGKLPSKHHLIMAVAFSPDGKLLAGSGHPRSGPPAAGRTFIWHLATGKVIHELPTSASCLAFTPSGRVLIATSSFKALQFWDVRAGIELGSLPLKAPLEMMSFASLSRDGRLMVTLDNMANLDLWELSTLQKIGRIGTHPTGVAITPDSRFLAVGSTSDLRIHDRALGEDRVPRLELDGVSGPWAFAAGGKLLVTVNWRGGSRLVWDVGDLTKAPLGRGEKLPGEELDRLWKLLAGEDAKAADDAFWKLAKVRDQTLELLQEHLRPVSRMEAARVDELIKRLSDTEFSVRDKASAELERQERGVEAALVRALKTDPPLEERRRIEQLLRKIEWEMGPQRRRQQRAVALLEQIEGAAALTVLGEIAAGDPEALLTLQAKGAIERRAKP